MKTRNLLIIVLPIMLAAGLANLITPPIYGVASSDFARTKLLLNTLKSGPAPDAALFGNSILMSGVDAKQLSSGLNLPLIFNLASNGQALKESMLYYSMIPAATQQVYQFVRLEDLENDLPAVTEAIVRNFRMYGYAYDSAKEGILSKTDMQYFHVGELKTNFDARVIVPNAINRSVRKLLRKDLDLESADNNLYFPNVYSQRVDTETYKTEIAKYNPPGPLTQFKPNGGTIALLLRAQSYFASRNVKYTIVLYPINPDLYNYTDSYKKDAVQKLSSISLTIIDCTNALDSGEFVDYWHVSRDGARTFTDSIIKQSHAF